MKINNVSFDGFDAVELVNSDWRLVLVTGIGPRIAFFGKKDGDKNILYWDKDGAQSGNWKLYGGHRVWVTRPFADESVDTYADDNEPCIVEQGDNWVRATAPMHPFTQLSRGIRVEALEDGAFRVMNFVRNDGPMVYSAGVWSPTCINPAGKTLRVPLGEDETTWDIVQVVIPHKYANNTVRIDDPQVTFEGNDMVIRSQGVLTKRCVKAPKGNASMEWPEENIVFTKHADYVRDGLYPLNGCNVAIFVGQDNWMGELETYGTEGAIRPGETATHSEIWQVKSLK